MPREFTSQKAIRNHAELTGYVYLWEGTHAFATRRRLLSPDQYEIVDVRTDRGMTRAMLFPKAILKAEWDAAAPLRDALTNQARAMAAIAVGEREEWTAPQRVKPVHSGVLHVLSGWSCTKARTARAARDGNARSDLLSEAPERLP